MLILNADTGQWLVVHDALPQGGARHLIADVDLVDISLDGDVLHVEAHGQGDRHTAVNQALALRPTKWLLIVCGRAPIKQTKVLKEQLAIFAGQWSSGC